MIAHRFANTAAFVVLVLSLPACVPCEHPLVDPAKCKFDERFVGVWKQVDRDKVNLFLHRQTAATSTDRPDGLMVIQAVTFHPDSELERGENPHVLLLGESCRAPNNYMQSPNLSNDADIKLTKWDTAKIKGYHLWRFEATHDRLTIYMMDKDGAAKAIEDGKLKGTIKKTKAITSPEVRITESTETGLNRYLAMDGLLQALFPSKRARSRWCA